MNLFVIDDKSPYLEQVIHLGDANKPTLGLFPRGAFYARAVQEQIIVALDENKNLLGYLLYGANNRDSLVSITHLCVDKKQRGKGVANKLFSKLKELTHEYFRGVRVRCRQDYEANRMWPKLGFTVRDEIAGHSEDGSVLTVWWYDYGYPTLFTFADEQRTRTKLKVAIDANIFYQLKEAPCSDNEEVHALLADWLGEYVELCLTAEIFNEISRNKDKSERERNRIFAEKFMRIPTSRDDGFDTVCKELRICFPENMNEQDESDLRHLARAVAAGISFFLTQDESLLKKTEEIYSHYNMRIIRPSDLIIYQDALVRESEYQPARLAGSQIVTERIGAEQFSFLDQAFRISRKEKKSEFKQKLGHILANPHVFQTDIIKDKNVPLALRIFDRSKENQLDIPVLRVREGSLASVLAKHIIFQAILTCSEEKRIILRITDDYISDKEIGQLKELGFFFADNCWMKINLAVADSTEKIARKLESCPDISFPLSEYVKKIVNILNSENNIGIFLEMEHSLFPAKFTNIPIPSFIVPIKAEWAMNLFDTGIAKQDLFGCEPNRMFNVENAYYRAAHPKIISAPGRILWYVKKSRTYQGAMCIRACSYLDEVVIDTPKSLFARFQGLGIYQWKDVYGTAGCDLSRKIMAFRFSKTELFRKPVDVNMLQKIWMTEESRKFQAPQSALRISNQRFFQIYRLGTEKTDDKEM